MRLRKHVNKIMSSIASAKPTSRISDTLRSSLSTPSTLAVQEAAKNTLVGLSQKLNSSGKAIAVAAKVGIGKSESNDNDYDGAPAVERVLRLVVGRRKNQKKGSRWQLLENVAEEDEDGDQDESEIEQNNDDERKEEMLPCATNAQDYSQISTNASTSKAGNAAQWQQQQQFQLYCLPESEAKASVFGQSKLQSQDKINTQLNNSTENEDEGEGKVDLNSSQSLHQIVMEGTSALLCNHERLDLLLELVNEQEQRAENEFAIKSTKNSSNFKEIIVKAFRKKLRRVVLVGRVTATGRQVADDNEENSIDSSSSSSYSHSHRRFDVKQSKLIKSGDNVISISGAQPSGKRSMKKRMSLFRRKLKPSPKAAAAEQPSSCSSSAITSNALVAISQTQARSRKKVIEKTLKSSGKYVGKALKTGFIAMGNSMIPQHYIFPSPLELAGSSRTTTWQEETGYYSASRSRTPYWREYEMYDQYEDDRRKYEYYYQQYAETRRRERHA